MPNLSWRSNKLWTEIKETLQGQRYIIVFDLETTGLSPANERIIELAAIRYRIGDDYTFEEDESLHLYINPGITLSEKIVELTGITDEFLEDKPLEADVFEEIEEFFGRTVVSGYNVKSFDVKFMQELYARNGTKYECKGIVDAIQMARDRIEKAEIGNYKLATVGDYFGIEFSAHTAIGDTQTTAEIVQLFLTEYVKTEACDGTAMPTGTERPEIKSITFWEGYKGFSRIYVNTEAGSLYYDIREHRWCAKDADMDLIDMDWLEGECWGKTNSQNEADFVKFNDVIKCA